LIIVLKYYINKTRSNSYSFVIFSQQLFLLNLPTDTRQKGPMAYIVSSKRHWRCAVSKIAQISNSGWTSR